MSSMFGHVPGEEEMNYPPFCSRKRLKCLDSMGMDVNSKCSIEDEGHADGVSTLELTFRYGYGVCIFSILCSYSEFLIE